MSKLLLAQQCGIAKTGSTDAHSHIPEVDRHHLVLGVCCYGLNKPLRTRSCMLRGRNELTLEQYMDYIPSLWGRSRRILTLNSFFGEDTDPPTRIPGFPSLVIASPIPNMPESSAVMDATSVFLVIMNVASEATKAVPWRWILASCLEGTLLTSVRAAGISEVVSSLGVSEVVQLTIALPVMAMAILCVWATHCSPAHESAAEPAPAHKFVPEPASAPELSPVSVLNMNFLSATTEVIPEFPVCPDMTMEVVPELFACPDMTTKVTHELPVCLDATTEVIPEFHKVSCLP